MKKILATGFSLLMIGNALMPNISAQEINNLQISQIPLQSIWIQNQTKKFLIDAPTIVTVNTPFSVTIRAVDNNNSLTPNYNGQIVFSTNWLGDVIPNPGQAIVFYNSDAGVKTFKNAFTFKKTGKQTIYVVDLHNDIMGQVDVLVTNEKIPHNEWILNPNPHNSENNSNKNNSSRNENANVWNFMHCSIVKKWFSWTDPVNNFANENTCGTSLGRENFNHSHINSQLEYQRKLVEDFIQRQNQTKDQVSQNTNSSQKISSEKLAEDYLEMRKNISKITKQNITTQNEVIIALKEFDKILENFSHLPKNILFTEYPYFVKMYHKYFSHSEMKEIAERENIRFLQEYAKITKGKQWDDIAFIVSYAPNFEYITETNKDYVFLEIQAYNTKWQEIDYNDIKTHIKELSNGFSLDGEKLKFQNIDKKKKYHFTAIISKKNGTSQMHHDFSLSFADQKIIDTITVNEVPQYKIFWWELYFKNAKNMNPDDKVNIFIAPIGSDITSSFRREWQTFNDNKDGATLTTSNSGDTQFLNYKQIWTYYLLKYFHNQ